MIVFNEYDDGIIRALRTFFIVVMRMKKQSEGLGVVLIFVLMSMKTTQNAL